MGHNGELNLSPINNGSSEHSSARNKMNMSDTERLNWLTYTHRWHEDGEAIVPVPDMENFIMTRLHEKFFRMSEHDRAKLFYHDFSDSQDGQGPVTVTEVDDGTFDQTPRRVLGCGHFLAMLTYLEYNSYMRDFGSRRPGFNKFWLGMRHTMRSRGLLDPRRECDCTQTYAWLLEFYRKIYAHMCHRIPDDIRVTENCIIPFALLRVTDPCRNADPVNYSEFLVLHLHCMHEMGILGGGPECQQYYHMMRKVDAPVPQELPMSQGYMEILYTVQLQIYFSWRNARLVAGQFKKGDESRIREQILRSKKSHVILQNSWQPSETYEQLGWIQFKQNIMLKITQEVWKLGCQGCPSTLQHRVTWSGRKRACKWVTIRRLVLVKRVYWVRVRPRRRLQRGQISA